MKLIVNCEPHEHHGDGTINALLEELGAKKEHTALLINGEVIPSRRCGNTFIKENNEVDVLVFVGGG